MERALLFEGCPEPLAIVVGDVIREKNPAWAHAVGSNPSLMACFAPEDEAAVRAAFAQAASARVSFEARLAVGPHRGASMRCITWSSGGEARCLRLDGPALATAAEIARSKDKALRWIFDQIDAALWVILHDGTLALSEGNALSRYGIRPGDYVGSNAWEMFPPESQTARTARRVLAGESVHDAYAEESQYWVQYGHPLRGEDGAVFAHIGLALAMTENVKDVRYGQELLRIINELPLVVWSMRADGTCTLSAGKGLERFGLVPGQLVGTKMFEFYKDDPLILEHYRRAFAGESFTSENEYRGDVWRNVYHPAIDGKGDVIGVFAVCEDVTERVRDERRIREQLSLIQAQKRSIDRLVSPVLEVWRGVLVVPLIGDLDEERAAVVTERLLGDVVRHAASFAILDLTGIDMVDTNTAQHLFNIMRGVDLLGCKALVSGIRPSVATTMVSLGLEVPTGRTYSNLAEALRRCMRSVEVRGR